MPPSARYFYPPHLDLDSNNSTSGGDDYRAEVTNDRTPVPISDTDSDIDDLDGGIITFAQITINNPFPGDVLSVIGTLPFGIFATPFDPFTGILYAVRFCLAFRLSDRDRADRVQHGRARRRNEEHFSLGIRRLLVE